MSEELLNIVKVGIHLEGDYLEKEYEIRIESFIGSICINRNDYMDDIGLINEAVEIHEDEIFLRKDEYDDIHTEGYFEVILTEWRQHDMPGIIERGYSVKQVVFHPLV